MIFVYFVLILFLDQNQLRAEPSTKPFDQQTADCNRLKTWLMREIIAVHELDDKIGSNKSVKDNMPLLNLWVDEILKSKFLWLKENFQQLHFSDSKSFYNIERVYENVTRSRIWRSSCAVRSGVSFVCNFQIRYHGRMGRKEQIFTCTF